MTVRTLFMVGPMAAVMALASVGCGATAGPGMTTAQRPAAAGAVPLSAQTDDSDYDKALRYTRCMTANGVTMRDPVEGEPLSLGGSGDGWQPLSTPAFEKCRNFLPAAWPVKADPKEIARQRPWAECMRQHGGKVPDLEPDARGMVHSPPDPNVYYTPEWRAAEAACRHLNGTGVVPLTE